MKMIYIEYQQEYQRAKLSNMFDINNRQKQAQEVLYKNGALKNFAKFTGKPLCLSIFSIFYFL